MKKGMGKRIISLGAAFCLCAGLCACSGSGASTSCWRRRESSPAPEEEGELRYELGKIYIQTEEILPAWLTGPTVQWTAVGDNRLVRLCYDEESNRIMVRWENYVFGFYEVIRLSGGISAQLLSLPRRAVLDVRQGIDGRIHEPVYCQPFHPQPPRPRGQPEQFRRLFVRRRDCVVGKRAVPG